MRVISKRAARTAIIAATGLACVLLGMTGCSKKPQADPFTEHWRKQEEKSQGYSPSPRQTARKKPVQIISPRKADSLFETGREKELPKNPVTLKMYNTSLVAVLRAMASAANVNIILPPEIPKPSQIFYEEKKTEGQETPESKPAAGNDNFVNINITNVPWDEALVESTEVV